MKPVFADVLSCGQECIRNFSCNFELVLPCSARIAMELCAHGQQQ